jgi:hypothetical protein
LAGYINNYYPVNDTRFQKTGLQGEIAQITIDITNCNQAIKNETANSQKYSYEVYALGWFWMITAMHNSAQRLDGYNKQAQVLLDGWNKLQALASNPANLVTTEEADIQVAAAPVAPTGIVSYSNTPVYTLPSGTQTLQNPATIAPSIPPIAAFALPALGIALIAILRK